MDKVIMQLTNEGLKKMLGGVADKDPDMDGLIRGFFRDMSEKDEIPVYNEASLKFELGCYLKNALIESGYVVNVERNVDSEPVVCRGNCQRKVENHVKDLMDFFIYRKDGDFEENYAIEVKYPRNGEYNGRYNEFSDDIRFMEQVSETYGMDSYCIVMVSNDTYCNKQNSRADDENLPLYGFYRTRVPSDAVRSADIEWSDTKHGKGRETEISRFLASRRKSPYRLTNGYTIRWNQLLDSKGNPVMQKDGLEGNESRVYLYVIKIEGAKMAGPKKRR